MSATGRLVAPLQNCGVLVTRPVEQADRLMSRLRDLGALPLLFPALDIVGPRQPDALRLLLSGIDQYDWLVFVSPTAVRFGMAALRLFASDAVLATINAAAVGNGTAEALRTSGCRNVLAPAVGADSEHLLALPEFADLAGRRVLILRGEGGRELIADTLRARGAMVDYAECYRRTCPTTDPAPLRRAFAEQRIQAITVFSGETLDNLLEMLGADAAPAARVVPLFVPHPRIAEHARAMAFTRVIATAPGEDGLLAGLVEYFSHD